MAVSKRLRFEILRRDNHTCRYCGESAPGVKLVIDHVLPEALGGQTEPENLVAACAPCNNGKASIAPDSPLVADVKQDAIRWARAMEIARIGDRAQRQERDDFRDLFEESWNRWKVSQGIKRVPLPLPIDWPLTIDAFMQAGLDEDDIAEAIDASMRRKLVDDKFKYFCGVAWNIARTRAETARVLAPLMDEIDTLPPAGDSGEPWDF